MVWLAAAVLGGVGALARFLLDGFVSQRESDFPVGTLAVNLSGALLLGLLVGLTIRGHALLLAGTALLGSYTTFSTWMFESHRLGEGSRVWLLWLNLVGSLAVGLAAAAVGRWLGGAL